MGILVSLIPWNFLYAMESFDTAWEKTFELVDRLESFFENDYTEGTLKGNIILTGEESDISKISIGFESDIKTEGKGKAERNINFGIDANSESEGNQTIKGKGNLLTDDGDFYVRLDHINALDMEDMNQLLNLYRNKWIKFPLKEYLSNTELTTLIDEYKKTQEEKESNKISFKDCFSNIISTTYRGEFSEYRGDSAYQFTIDWGKVFDLYGIDDSDTIKQGGTWYLIIDGTERIFVVEDFDLSSHWESQKHSMHIWTNGFYRSVKMEEIEIILQIKEITEGNYDVMLKIQEDDDIVEVKGNLHLDVSKDKIDLSLNLPFEENDTAMHGEVNYEYHMQKAISSEIMTPTESIDFMELYLSIIFKEFQNNQTTFDYTNQEEQSDLSSYPEKYLNAYQWAYANGITTMKTIDEAKMYNEVTRAEMAKMIGQFAKSVWNRPEDYSKNCNFKDGEVWSDLTEWIKTSCRLGIMGQDGKWGTNEYFNPNGYVTKAEFWTMLSRIIRGDLYDGWEPYYQSHIEQLQYRGIMDKDTSPFINEKRGDIMEMLQYSYYMQGAILAW